MNIIFSPQLISNSLDNDILTALAFTSPIALSDDEGNKTNISSDIDTSLIYYVKVLEDQKFFVERIAKIRKLHKLDRKGYTPKDLLDLDEKLKQLNDEKYSKIRATVDSVFEGINLPEQFLDQVVYIVMFNTVVFANELSFQINPVNKRGSKGVKVEIEIYSPNVSLNRIKKVLESRWLEITDYLNKKKNKTVKFPSVESVDIWNTREKTGKPFKEIADEMEKKYGYSFDELDVIKRYGYVKKALDRILTQ